MQRFCLQFYCDERGDRYCCADCFLRRDCARPCMNNPVRCRLEDIKGRPKSSHGHKRPWLKTPKKGGYIGPPKD